MKKQAVNKMQLPALKALYPLLILFALALSGCGQADKGNTGTLIISLPNNALEQMNQSAVGTREVSGKPQDINRIIITLADTNGSVIASGDIIQSGNVLRFTVPAHVDMVLSGVAYNAANVERFKGETTIEALAPGDTARPSLILDEIFVTPPPPNLTGFVALAGISSISSSTVTLYEVDNSGAIVGPAIATSAVDIEGGYGLVVPDTVTFDSKFILRFEAVDVAILDARYIGDSIEISPISHAASQLVSELSAANSLDVITVDEIKEIQELLTEVEARTDLTSFTQVDTYVAALLTELKSNLNTRNIVSSMAANGQICGTVQDDATPTPNPLANIRIVVRDFDTQLLRARTKTDPDGTYCVNVPRNGETDTLAPLEFAKGDYIVGALNFTTTSTAASAWWKNNLPSGTRLRVDADKISIFSAEFTAATAPIGYVDFTADFNLVPGARISGNVTASGVGGLPGVKVLVRDAKTQFLTAAATIQDTGGNYVVNVAPGDYIIEARNTVAKHAYAGASYSTNTPGTNNRNFADVITLAAGDLSPGKDFVLEPGVAVTGTVSEGGVPVTGVRVVVNLSGTSGGGPSTRLLVFNADGTFRIWLKPDTYNVDVYGQSKLASLVGAPSVDLLFDAPVAKLPVIAQAPDGSPISKLKLSLLDMCEGICGAIHDNYTRSDGSAMLYTETQSSTYVVDGRIDDAQVHSSIIYDDKLNIFDGNLISLTPGNVAATITVKTRAAGVLTGTVTNDISGIPQAVPNMIVRVLSQGNRFVQTRTRGDGSYTLSLPQDNYTSVLFTDNVNQFISCLDVPVSVNTTTVLDLNMSAVANVCQQSNPNLIKIGSVYFDPAVSWDLSLHALKFPTTDWPMIDYINTGGAVTNYSFVVNDPIYALGSVPTTISTYIAFGGELTQHEALAIAVDGGLYRLGTDTFLPIALPYEEPVLIMPATLTPNTSWVITDGTIAKNQIGLAQVIAVNNPTPSPAGFTYTTQILFNYTVSNGEVWNRFYRVSEGLLEEDESTLNQGWIRSDILPQLPIGLQ